MQGYDIGSELWCSDHQGRYALDGEINLGGGIMYRLMIANLGLDLPIVGEKRAIRYLGPADGNVDRVVLDYPGFGHTSLSYDPDWVIRHR